jgi:hypothetical protein
MNATSRQTDRNKFSHPDGTHDDRLWALALAAHATKQTPPPSIPIARLA